MREIKFRAWDKLYKEMKDWDELRYEENGYTFSHPDYEIMQYTGLKDKNGKEIYEGDIIDKMIVTYSGDNKESLGMNVGWYLQRDDFESWTELNSNDFNVVIGNIYENPKLLDKE